MRKLHHQLRLKNVFETVHFDRYDLNVAHLLCGGPILDVFTTRQESEQKALLERQQFTPTYCGLDANGASTSVQTPTYWLPAFHSKTTRQNTDATMLHGVNGQTDLYKTMLQWLHVQTYLISL